MAFYPTKSANFGSDHRKAKIMVRGSNWILKGTLSTVGIVFMTRKYMVNGSKMAANNLRWLNK